jgi:PhnB protein
MATRAKRAVPEGFHTVTPYFICKGAAKALDWYKQALGAEERYRMAGPGGAVMHAEIKLGDCIMMLADEFPEMGAKSPQSLGGSPVGFCIYVQDCDSAFKRAVDAGAKVERPIQDQFYGDRSGTVIDPFGHKWTISTHTEDLTPAEIEQRQKEWMAKQKH